MLRSFQSYDDEEKEYGHGSYAKGELQEYYILSSD